VRRSGLTTMIMAAVAYKLGKNNVQQIEQYSGKPIDQMSEEELNACMDDLDIELPAEEGGEYDDDQHYDDAPVQEPDYMQELQQLAGLRDQGIIIDEDFEAKKVSSQKTGGSPSH